MAKRERPFNLNMSKKPETLLARNLSDELINIYGVQCLWLFSERVNEEKLVFRDFSHFRVDQDYKQVTLLPENMEDWDDERTFNMFGMFQAYTINMFISVDDLLYLYPDFFEKKNGFKDIVNSLIMTPSSTILEITDIQDSSLGISNLYTYSDRPVTFKLNCKIYAPNISDEGVEDIKDTINLEEGPENSRLNGDRIFEEDVDVDTNIDEFFKGLESLKENQDEEGNKKSKTGSVFGSLS